MRYTDIRRSEPARHDSRSSSRPLNSSRNKSRMPSLFNIIRGVIFASAILFSIICLAMAGHFQNVLAASDLTRFVPFAIFVCSASLFIITVLLSCSLALKERNPISTRIEIVCLGLAGILWLVLGVYLTTSESQDADVECFASETATQPLDPSAAMFHTDQYQAMYRVLMIFALLNAILLLASFTGLLSLAWRKHKQGDQHMWYGPVTSCAWFNSYSKPTKRSGRSQQSGGILPTNHRSQSHRYTEAPVRKHSSRRQPPATSRVPETREKESYPHVYQHQRTRPERQGSGRRPQAYSPPISPMAETFENGGMRNPNRKGSR
ncbi:hypothetical protein Moror_7360 [Moniliophthora roreri MCA 2997]|uniref:MARVEL domain-containing protein n=1 Tax=Moniliophthora roreri (strain MCA 2997) TaxID=1381753 RepID=V2XTZ6_MONRO|nr:hypothetical protein Moror_7360 [Moniliophthora roreri MCA 2997]